MYFIGNANFDNQTGSIDDDVLDGGAGNDTLNGSAGSDLLYGGAGDDSLGGGTGDDLIYGEAGNDLLRGGSGADLIDGGLGFDAVTYSDARSGVIVDLMAGGTAGDAAGDVFNSIERIENSLFDDVIFGNAHATWFTDNQGSDRIVGRDAGGDTYSAYAEFNGSASAFVDVEIAFGSRAEELATQGGITLTPGAAIAYRIRADATVEYDVLEGIENFEGSSGNDRITGDSGANVIAGSSGNDTLDGADGFDFLSFASEGPVVANLGTGVATTGSYVDEVSGFEGVIGSFAGDYFRGSATAERLEGRGGNDVLRGGAGNDHLLGDTGTDVLAGEAGADRLDGGDGADLLDGGDGLDWVTYEGSQGGVYVDLLARAGLTLVLDGIAQAGGQSLGDRYISIENLTGSKARDYLQGDNNGNRIEGLDGDDEIYGCGGDDLLYGDYMPNRNAGLPAAVVPVAIHEDEECEDCTDDGAVYGGAADLNAPASADWGDYISGGDGNDLLSGQSGSDMLLGDCGNDTLLGGTQVDVLFGGDDDDVLEGGESFDILFGGAGMDTASYESSASAVSVNLAEFWSNSGGDAASNLVNEVLGMLTSDDTDDIFANALFTGMLAQLNDQALELVSLFQLPDIFFGIEGLTGSRFNDTLIGDSGNNVLDGGSGSDTMRGGNGSDYYYVRNAGDSVSETNATASTGGSDTVYTYLSAYTLGANVEMGQIMSTGAANITGNTLNNVLYAGQGNNVIAGGDGADTVSYYYGVNGATGVTVSLALTTAQATGGSGSDTLSGIEHLYGSNNADKLTGDSGANELIGYNGDDTLEGGLGIDTMTGGDGSDIYYVRDTGDSVSETTADASTGGTDTVYIYLNAYTLGANIENGQIKSTGIANITGNALDNVLYAGQGNNVMRGGAGMDAVSYLSGVTGTTGVTVSLVPATAQATGGSGSDTLSGFEHLFGSNNADTLTGDGGANQLTGYAGNDTINGSGGDDTIDGGVGVDSMNGGNGSDYYYVRNAGDSVSETTADASTGGTDTVYTYLSTYTLSANVEIGQIVSTGAANLIGNTLNNVLYAGQGNNVIAGGNGADTVSYYYGVNGATGVTVSLALTTAQATGGSGSDTLSGIEHLYGSNNADRLTGNSSANELIGYNGKDTLDGGLGVDTMTGGDGSDTYYVRDTGDSVSETTADASTGGTDTVYTYINAYTLGANIENGRITGTGVADLTGNALSNQLFAGKGDNVMDGGDGVDAVTYLDGVSGATGVTVSLDSAVMQDTGGSGSDTLIGFEHLFGSNNADTLTGDSAANKLIGYDGNDTISAGGGNDTLTGGVGKDSLTGGSGNDIFDYNTLLDTGFTDTSWDVINDFVLGQDKIDLETLDANTATTADDVFTSVIASGALFTAAGQLRYEGGVLYGNTNADSAAEFAIQLAVVSLSTSDFFL